jgi:hypothetical protein
VERPYKDDPELGDENDPAYMLELFETAKAMGWGPEDIRTDEQFRADYAAWLKK